MNLSIDLNNFSMNKKKNSNELKSMRYDINNSFDVDEFQRFEGGIKDA